MGGGVSIQTGDRLAGRDSEKLLSAKWTEKEKELGRQTYRYRQRRSGFLSEEDNIIIIALN